MRWAVLMVTLWASAACSGTDDKKRSQDSEDTEQSTMDTGSTEDTAPPITTTPITTPETTDTGTPPLQICINEFMADNISSLQDETGEHPDWIELHNPGDQDVELDGWSITDDASDPTKVLLSAELVVPAGGFLVLFADGRPDLGPEHLDFGLDSSGESVGLYRGDERGAVVNFGQLDADLAAARSSDCCAGDCWEYVRIGTPGTTNADAPYPQ